MSDRLAPLVGAIVWAWMPQDENPTKPGPKCRPVLVLSVNSNGIVVAYGTSQRTDRYGRAQFTVSPEEMPGLEKTTKFDLLNRKTLTRDPDFFLYKGSFSVIGSVLRDKKFNQRFKRALSETDIGS